MTLVVSSYWLDPTTGDCHQFTDWNDGHFMAGVEAARQDLWGSDAVKSLGAKFLPQLADANLHVEPASLDAFEAEVRMLLANVDVLRRQLGRGRECLLPTYLDNFLRAIAHARQQNGGVNIT